MKIVALFALCLLPSLTTHAQSIESLPILSTLLTHHFDCRAAILPGVGPSKELNFQFSPNASGHDGYEFTVSTATDKAVVAVNVQMLQILWTRGSQTVAAAQTMIQRSPTKAYVLIVTDPRDESTQVHLNCNAVTYADLNRGPK